MERTGLGFEYFLLIKGVKFPLKKGLSLGEFCKNQEVIQQESGSHCSRDALSPVWDFFFTRIVLTSAFDYFFFYYFY